MTATPFERVLSRLIAAIGDVERLQERPAPDQLARIRCAATRLTAAYYQHSKEPTCPA